MCSSLKLGLGVAHQAGHAGETLAHTHALLLVQEERVSFDGQVMLQSHFGLYQSLQGALSLHQPLLELMDGVLDLSHLTHKSTKKKGIIRKNVANTFDICKMFKNVCQIQLRMTGIYHFKFSGQVVLSPLKCVCG